jgi:hypothetical protein
MEGVPDQGEIKEKERRKQVFDKYLHSSAYQEILIQRLQINDACDRKADARGITWNLCARPENPAEGCIFFIENFGWTFNPRQAPFHMPFVLFEYQRDSIRWMVDHIDNGTDGLIEKSRDMGATWLVIWVFFWYWLFRDGVNLLVGSFKEKLVDDRTDDSMFGRLDYCVNNMPKWLLPKGFAKSKHRTQMKLVNPANNNLIAGDTMNPDFGRGSRKTAIFFDELGSWDYAKDAWDGCDDVTDCKIANSTPKGMNFYAKLRKSGIDVITLHWKAHPLKDDQWYAYEKFRRTEESVAQEIDISYTKSQEGRVYPEWNDVYIEEGQFEYDPGLPLYVGWDFGQTDDTAIVWVQKGNDGLRIVDSYRNTGKTIDFYVPFIHGVISSDNFVYNENDMKVINGHKYWNRGTHFGDPAGRFVNQVTNTSVLDVLKANGIVINFQDAWKEFQKRKTAVKLLVRDGIKLNKNARTEYFSMCMNQASYPKVRVEGEVEIRSIKPLHNWTSHYRSAFEYLALGLQEFSALRNKPYDKFKRKEGPTRGRTLGY